MIRHLMAAASSLLVIGLVYAYWTEGYLSQRVFVIAAGAIATLVVFFNVLFRTHLNMRFPDPSLTMEQIGSALVVLVYVNYNLTGGHGAFLLVYIVAILFAVFRLTTGQWYLLTLPVIAAHGFIFARRVGAGSSAGIELLQWLVLTVVLLWFVQLGGYISNMRRQLRALATRVELTGAYSRRHMLDVLRSEKAKADRRGTAFTVAVLDLDRFKSINDRFGHAGGDAVLREFAAVARRAVRESDYFGRYGGEEFMLILPETDAAGAKIVLERVREETRRSVGEHLAGDYTVTVSGGLREYRSGDSIDALIQEADRALYAAKTGGRDRIVAALAPAHG